MPLRRIQLSDTSLNGLRGKLGRESVFRDEPYAFEHWRRQQTWKRYLEPFDCWRVVINVFWPVTLVAVVATALGLYKELGQEQHGWPWFAENSNAVEWGLPFSTTSFAISLLLVFRTNESYRRWWEARRCIGRLCTSMRNLMRQAMAWFHEDDDGEALLEAMCRWCICLPHMMLFHVCEGHDMQVILKEILLPHELAFLKEQERPTFGVTACMTYIVAAAKITWEQQQSMDGEIRGGLQEFGGSDDILRQPLPMAYTRHTSRFLIVWLLCLPVAIWQVYGWATPVICAGVAFFLLGIENIGIQIEEPFSVLPLDKIAHRLRLDLLEMMEHMKAGKTAVSACLRLRHLYHPPGGQDMCAPHAKLAPIPSFNNDSAHAHTENLPVNPVSAFANMRDDLPAVDKTEESHGFPHSLQHDVLRTLSGNSDTLTEIITSSKSIKAGLVSEPSLAKGDELLSVKSAEIGDRRHSMHRQNSKSLAPDTFWRPQGGHHSRKSSSFSSRKSGNV